MIRDLFASVILAVGCFLFFTLVIPQFGAILDANSALEQRQALLTERSKLKDDFSNLLKEYQSRETDIEKLAVLLPAHKQIDQIVSSLQTIASQNGLFLKSMSVAGETASLTPFHKTFVKLELSATYPAMVNFLKEVEKSLRLYDIFEIIVGQESGSAPKGTLSLEVKLNTYNKK